MSNKLPLLIKYVEEMYLEGGPKLEHYVQLTNWFDNVHLARQEGGTESELMQLRTAFGPAMGMQTMQSRSWLKPRGYPRDFEIIDNIYLKNAHQSTQLKTLG